MVKDVFSQKSLMNLIGPMGVGHGNYFERLSFFFFFFLLKN